MLRFTKWPNGFLQQEKLLRNILSYLKWNVKDLCLFLKVSDVSWNTNSNELLVNIYLMWRYLLLFIVDADKHDF